MKIITNNQPRLLLDWNQLTPKEQKEREHDDPHGSYVRYKGWVYDAQNDFMYTGQWKKWDGIISDSFFSGVLIKFVDDDHVIMGRYFE